MPIHLKPVNDKINFTLFLSAIFCIIGVDTTVLAMKDLVLSYSNFDSKKSVSTIIDWFPFICIKSSLKSLTTIPNLSASGSVPITKSLLFFLAISIASINANLSSGFDDFAWVKLPSGVICLSTSLSSKNPVFFKSVGISLCDVPCNEVKTIFKFFSEFGYNLLKKDNDFSTYNSSIELSSVWIRFSFCLNFISEYLTLLISSVNLLSIGGTICPPSSQ